jgi:hypothetical protein
MSQSTRGERITAAASALAAIVILGAAVTAQQSRMAPVSQLARLESDLRFQLYLAHHTDGGRLAQRLTELNHTLDAWQRSPRTAADDQLLAEWLAASIQRSMPGESGELPVTPAFSRPPEPLVLSPPVVKVQPSPVEPTPLPAAQPVVEPAIVAEATVDAVPVSPPKPLETKTPDPLPRVAMKGVARAEPVEAKPVSTKPIDAKPVAAKPVVVNLAELNARIAGYHQGLAAVEATIAAGVGPLDMAQLAVLVEQVEQLGRQYELVTLYFQSLTDAERAIVTAPRSLAPTIELVDRERTHLERGGEGDFLAAFEVGGDGKESPLARRLRAVAQRVEPEAAN